MAPSSCSSATAGGRSSSTVSTPSSSGESEAKRKAAGSRTLKADCARSSSSKCNKPRGHRTRRRGDRRGNSAHGRRLSKCSYATGSSTGRISKGTFSASSRHTSQGDSENDTEIYSGSATDSNTKSDGCRSSVSSASCAAGSPRSLWSSTSSSAATDTSELASPARRRRPSSGLFSPVSTSAPRTASIVSPRLSWRRRSSYTRTKKHKHTSRPSSRKGSADPPYSTGSPLSPLISVAVHSQHLARSENRQCLVCHPERLERNKHCNSRIRRRKARRKYTIPPVPTRGPLHGKSHVFCKYRPTSSASVAPSTSETTPLLGTPLFLPPRGLRKSVKSFGSNAAGGLESELGDRSGSCPRTVENYLPLGAAAEYFMPAAVCRLKSPASDGLGCSPSADTLTSAETGQRTNALNCGRTAAAASSTLATLATSVLSPACKEKHRRDRRGSEPDGPTLASYADGLRTLQEQCATVARTAWKTSATAVSDEERFGGCDSSSVTETVYADVSKELQVIDALSNARQRCDHPVDANSPTCRLFGNVGDSLMLQQRLCAQHGDSLPQQMRLREQRDLQCSQLHVASPHLHENLDSSAHCLRAAGTTQQHECERSVKAGHDPERLESLEEGAAREKVTAGTAPLRECGNRKKKEGLPLVRRTIACVQGQVGTLHAGDAADFLKSCPVVSDSPSLKNSSDSSGLCPSSSSSPFSGHSACTPLSSSLAVSVASGNSSSADDSAVGTSSSSHHASGERRASGKAGGLTGAAGGCGVCSTGKNLTGDLQYTLGNDKRARCTIPSCCGWMPCVPTSCGTPSVAELQQRRCLGPIGGGEQQSKLFSDQRTVHRSRGLRESSNNKTTGSSTENNIGESGGVTATRGSSCSNGNGNSACVDSSRTRAVVKAAWTVGGPAAEALDHVDIVTRRLGLKPRRTRSGDKDTWTARRGASETVREDHCPPARSTPGEKHSSTSANAGDGWDKLTDGLKAYTRRKLVEPKTSFLTAAADSAAPAPTGGDGVFCRSDPSPDAATVDGISPIAAAAAAVEVTVVEEAAERPPDSVREIVEAYKTASTKIKMKADEEKMYSAVSTALHGGQRAVEKLENVSRRLLLQCNGGGKTVSCGCSSSDNSQGHSSGNDNCNSRNNACCGRSQNSSSCTDGCKGSGRCAKEGRKKIPEEGFVPKQGVSTSAETVVASLAYGIVGGSYKLAAAMGGGNGNATTIATATGGSELATPAVQEDLPRQVEWEKLLCAKDAEIRRTMQALIEARADLAHCRQELHESKAEAAAAKQRANVACRLLQLIKQRRFAELEELETLRNALELCQQERHDAKKCGSRSPLRFSYNNNKGRSSSSDSGVNNFGRSSSSSCGRGRDHRDENSINRRRKSRLTTPSVQSRRDTSASGCTSCTAQSRCTRGNGSASTSNHYNGNHSGSSRSGGSSSSSSFGDSSGGSSSGSTLTNDEVITSSASGGISSCSSSNSSSSGTAGDGVSNNNSNSISDHNRSIDGTDSGNSASGSNSSNSSNSRSSASDYRRSNANGGRSSGSNSASSNISEGSGSGGSGGASVDGGSNSRGSSSGGSSSSGATRSEFSISSAEGRSSLEKSDTSLSSSASARETSYSSNHKKSAGSPTDEGSSSTSKESDSNRRGRGRVSTGKSGCDRDESFSSSSSNGAASYSGRGARSSGSTRSKGALSDGRYRTRSCSVSRRYACSSKGGSSRISSPSNRGYRACSSTVTYSRRPRQCESSCSGSSEWGFTATAMQEILPRAVPEVEEEDLAAAERWLAEEYERDETARTEELHSLRAALQQRDEAVRVLEVKGEAMRNEVAFLQSLTEELQQERTASEERLLLPLKEQIKQLEEGSSRLAKEKEVLRMELDHTRSTFSRQLAQVEMLNAQLQAEADLLQTQTGRQRRLQQEDFDRLEREVESLRIEKERQEKDLRALATAKAQAEARCKHLRQQQELLLLQQRKLQESLKSIRERARKLSTNRDKRHGNTQPLLYQHNIPEPIQESSLWGALVQPHVLQKTTKLAPDVLGTPAASGRSSVQMPASLRFSHLRSMTQASFSVGDEARRGTVHQRSSIHTSVTRRSSCPAWENSYDSGTGTSGGGSAGGNSEESTLLHSRRHSSSTRGSISSQYYRVSSSGRKASNINSLSRRESLTDGSCVTSSNSASHTGSLISGSCAGSSNNGSTSSGYTGREVNHNKKGDIRSGSLEEDFEEATSNFHDCSSRKVGSSRRDPFPEVSRENIRSDETPDITGTSSTGLGVSDETSGTLERFSFENMASRLHSLKAASQRRQQEMRRQHNQRIRQQSSQARSSSCVSRSESLKTLDPQQQHSYATSATVCSPRGSARAGTLLSDAAKERRSVRASTLHSPRTSETSSEASVISGAPSWRRRSSAARRSPQCSRQSALSRESEVCCRRNSASLGCRHSPYISRRASSVSRRDTGRRSTSNRRNLLSRPSRTTRKSSCRVGSGSITSNSATRTSSSERSSSGSVRCISGKCTSRRRQSSRSHDVGSSRGTGCSTASKRTLSHTMCESPRSSTSSVELRRGSSRHTSATRGSGDTSVPRSSRVSMNSRRSSMRRAAERMVKQGSSRRSSLSDPSRTSLQRDNRLRSSKPTFSTGSVRGRGSNSSSSPSERRSTSSPRSSGVVINHRHSSASRVADSLVQTESSSNNRLSKSSGESVQRGSQVDIGSRRSSMSAAADSILRNGSSIRTSLSKSSGSSVPLDNQGGINSRRSTSSKRDGSILRDDSRRNTGPESHRGNSSRCSTGRRTENTISKRMSTRLSTASKQRNTVANAESDEGSTSSLSESVKARGSSVQSVSRGRRTISTQRDRNLSHIIQSGHAHSPATSYSSSSSSASRVVEETRSRAPSTCVRRQRSSMGRESLSSRTTTRRRSTAAAGSGRPPEEARENACRSRPSSAADSDCRSRRATRQASAGLDSSRRITRSSSRSNGSRAGSRTQSEEQRRSACSNTLSSVTDSNCCSRRETQLASPGQHNSRHSSRVSSRGERLTDRGRMSTHSGRGNSKCASRAPSSVASYTTSDIKESRHPRSCSVVVGDLSTPVSISRTSSKEPGKASLSMSARNSRRVTDETVPQKAESFVLAADAAGEEQDPTGFASSSSESSAAILDRSERTRLSPGSCAAPGGVSSPQRTPLGRANSCRRSNRSGRTSRSSNRSSNSSSSNNNVGSGSSSGYNCRLTVCNSISNDTSLQELYEVPSDYTKQEFAAAGNVYTDGQKAISVDTEDRGDRISSCSKEEESHYQQQAGTDNVASERPSRVASPTEAVGKAMEGAQTKSEEDALPVKEAFGDEELSLYIYRPSQQYEAPSSPDTTRTQILQLLEQEHGQREAALRALSTICVASPVANAADQSKCLASPPLKQRTTGTRVSASIDPYLDGAAGAVPRHSKGSPRSRGSSRKSSGQSPPGNTSRKGSKRSTAAERDLSRQSSSSNEIQPEQSDDNSSRSRRSRVDSTSESKCKVTNSSLVALSGKKDRSRSNSRRSTRLEQVSSGIGRGSSSQRLQIPTRSPSGRSICGSSPHQQEGVSSGRNNRASTVSRHNDSGRREKSFRASRTEDGSVTAAHLVENGEQDLLMLSQHQTQHRPQQLREQHDPQPAMRPAEEELTQQQLCEQHSKKLSKASSVDIEKQQQRPSCHSEQHFLPTREKQQNLHGAIKRPGSVASVLQGSKDGNSSHCWRDTLAEERSENDPHLLFDTSSSSSSCSSSYSCCCPTLSSQNSSSSSSRGCSCISGSASGWASASRCACSAIATEFSKRSQPLVAREERQLLQEVTRRDGRCVGLESATEEVGGSRTGSVDLGGAQGVHRGMGPAGTDSGDRSAFASPLPRSSSAHSCTNDARETGFSQQQRQQRVLLRDLVTHNSSNYAGISKAAQSSQREKGELPHISSSEKGAPLQAGDNDSTRTAVAAAAAAMERKHSFQQQQIKLLEEKLERTAAASALLRQQSVTLFRRNQELRQLRELLKQTAELQRTENSGSQIISNATYSIVSQLVGPSEPVCIPCRKPTKEHMLSSCIGEAALPSARGATASYGGPDLSCCAGVDALSSFFSSSSSSSSSPSCGLLTAAAAFEDSSSRCGTRVAGPGTTTLCAESSGVTEGQDTLTEGTESLLILSTSAALGSSGSCSSTSAALPLLHPGSRVCSHALGVGAGSVLAACPPSLACALVAATDDNTTSSVPEALGSRPSASCGNNSPLQHRRLESCRLIRYGSSVSSCEYMPGLSNTHHLLAAREVKDVCDPPSAGGAASSAAASGEKGVEQLAGGVAEKRQQQQQQQQSLRLSQKNGGKDLQHSEPGTPRTAHQDTHKGYKHQSSRSVRRAPSCQSSRHHSRGRGSSRGGEEDRARQKREPLRDEQRHTGKSSLRVNGSADARPKQRERGISNGGASGSSEDYAGSFGSSVEECWRAALAYQAKRQQSMQRNKTVIHASVGDAAKKEVEKKPTARHGTESGRPSSVFLPVPSGKEESIPRQKHGKRDSHRRSGREAGSRSSSRGLQRPLQSSGSSSNRLLKDNHEEGVRSREGSRASQRNSGGPPRHDRSHTAKDATTISQGSGREFSLRDTAETEVGLHHASSRGRALTRGSDGSQQVLSQQRNKCSSGSRRNHSTAAAGSLDDDGGVPLIKHRSTAASSPTAAASYEPERVRTRTETRKNIASDSRRQSTADPRSSALTPRDSRYAAANSAAVSAGSSIFAARSCRDGSRTGDPQGLLPAGSTLNNTQWGSRAASKIANASEKKPVGVFESSRHNLASTRDSRKCSARTLELRSQHEQLEPPPGRGSRAATLSSEKDINAVRPVRHAHRVKRHTIQAYAHQLEKKLGERPEQEDLPHHSLTHKSCAGKTVNQSSEPQQWLLLQGVGNAKLQQLLHLQRKQHGQDGRSWEKRSMQHRAQKQRLRKGYRQTWRLIVSQLLDKHYRTLLPEPEEQMSGFDEKRYSLQKLFLLRLMMLRRRAVGATRSLRPTMRRSTALQGSFSTPNAHGTAAHTSMAAAAPAAEPPVSLFTAAPSAAVASEMLSPPSKPTLSQALSAAEERAAAASVATPLAAQYLVSTARSGAGSSTGSKEAVATASKAFSPTATASDVALLPGVLTATVSGSANAEQTHIAHPAVESVVVAASSLNLKTSATPIRESSEEAVSYTVYDNTVSERDGGRAETGVLPPSILLTVPAAGAAETAPLPGTTEANVTLVSAAVACPPVSKERHRGTQSGSSGRNSTPPLMPSLSLADIAAVGTSASGGRLLKLIQRRLSNIRRGYPEQRRAIARIATARQKAKMASLAARRPRVPNILHETSCEEGRKRVVERVVSSNARNRGRVSAAVTAGGKIPLPVTFGIDRERLTEGMGIRSPVTTERRKGASGLTRAATAPGSDHILGGAPPRGREIPLREERGGTAITSVGRPCPAESETPKAAYLTGSVATFNAPPCEKSSGAAAEGALEARETATAASDVALLPYASCTAPAKPQEPLALLSGTATATPRGGRAADPATNTGEVAASDRLLTDAKRAKAGQRARSDGPSELSIDLLKAASVGTADANPATAVPRSTDVSSIRSVSVASTERLCTRRGALHLATSTKIAGDEPEVPAKQCIDCTGIRSSSHFRVLCVEEPCHRSTTQAASIVTESRSVAGATETALHQSVALEARSAVSPEAKVAENHMKVPGTTAASAAACTSITGGLALSTLKSALPLPTAPPATTDQLAPSSSVITPPAAFEMRQTCIPQHTTESFESHGCVVKSTISAEEASTANRRAEGGRASTPKAATATNAEQINKAIAASGLFEHGHTIRASPKACIQVVPTTHAAARATVSQVAASLANSSAIEEGEASAEERVVTAAATPTARETGGEKSTDVEVAGEAAANEAGTHSRSKTNSPRVEVAEAAGMQEGSTASAASTFSSTASAALGLSRCRETTGAPAPNAAGREAETSYAAPVMRAIHTEAPTPSPDRQTRYYVEAKSHKSMCSRLHNPGVGCCPSSDSEKGRSTSVRSSRCGSLSGRSADGPSSCYRRTSSQPCHPFLGLAPGHDRHSDSGCNSDDSVSSCNSDDDGSVENVSRAKKRRRYDRGGLTAVSPSLCSTVASDWDWLTLNISCSTLGAPGVAGNTFSEAAFATSSSVKDSHDSTHGALGLSTYVNVAGMPETTLKRGSVATAKRPVIVDSADATPVSRASCIAVTAHTGHVSQGRATAGDPSRSGPAGPLCDGIGDLDGVATTDGGYGERAADPLKISAPSKASTGGTIGEYPVNVSEGGVVSSNLHNNDVTICRCPFSGVNPGTSELLPPADTCVYHTSSEKSLDAACDGAPSSSNGAAGLRLPNDAANSADTAADSVLLLQESSAEDQSYVKSTKTHDQPSPFAPHLALPLSLCVALPEVPPANGVQCLVPGHWMQNSCESTVLLPAYLAQSQVQAQRRQQQRPQSEQQQEPQNDQQQELQKNKEQQKPHSEQQQESQSEKQQKLQSEQQEELRREEYREPQGKLSMLPSQRCLSPWSTYNGTWPQQLRYAEGEDEMQPLEMEQQHDVYEGRGEATGRRGAAALHAQKTFKRLFLAAFRSGDARHLRARRGNGTRSSCSWKVRSSSRRSSGASRCCLREYKGSQGHRGISCLPPSLLAHQHAKVSAIVVTKEQQRAKAPRGDHKHQHHAHLEESAPGHERKHSHLRLDPFKQQRQQYSHMQPHLHKGLSKLPSQESRRRCSSEEIPQRRGRGFHRQLHCSKHCSLQRTTESVEFSLLQPITPKLEAEPYSGAQAEMPSAAAEASKKEATETRETVWSRNCVVERQFRLIQEVQYSSSLLSLSAGDCSTGVERMSDHMGALEEQQLQQDGHASLQQENSECKIARKVSALLPQPSLEDYQHNTVNNGIWEEVPVLPANMLPRGVVAGPADEGDASAVPADRDRSAEGNNHVIADSLMSWAITSEAYPPCSPLIDAPVLREECSTGYTEGRHASQAVAVVTAAAASAASQELVPQRTGESYKELRENQDEEIGEPVSGQKPPKEELGVPEYVQEDPLGHAAHEQSSLQQHEQHQWQSKQEDSYQRIERSPHTQPKAPHSQQRCQHLKHHQLEGLQQRVPHQCSEHAAAEKEGGNWRSAETHSTKQQHEACGGTGCASEKQQLQPQQDLQPNQHHQQQTVGQQRRWPSRLKQHPQHCKQQREKEYRHHLQQQHFTETAACRLSRLTRQHQQPVEEPVQQLFLTLHGGRRRCEACPLLFLRKQKNLMQQQPQAVPQGPKQQRKKGIFVSVQAKERSTRFKSSHGRYSKSSPPATAHMLRRASPVNNASAVDASRGRVPLKAGIRRPQSTGATAPVDTAVVNSGGANPCAPRPVAVAEAAGVVGTGGHATVETSAPSSGARRQRPTALSAIDGTSPEETVLLLARVQHHQHLQLQYQEKLLQQLHQQVFGSSGADK